MVAVAATAAVVGFAAMAGHFVTKDARVKEAYKDSVATPSLVALIAFCFGALFGGGVSTAMWTEDGVVYAGALALMLLAFFHWSEFFLQAIFRADVIDISSFHLDHSTAYKAMVGLFIGEYLLEILVMPALKGISMVTFVGFVIAAGGLALRCLAMIKADQNFSHVIEDEKRDEHKLVTTGIYSYMRHPSYAGFFWWSVGMQVMLANPVSFGVALYGNFKFFSSRIPYEEKRMSSDSYFGKDYARYKFTVRSGVPLIP